MKDLIKMNKIWSRDIIDKKTKWILNQGDMKWKYSMFNKSYTWLYRVFLSQRSNISHEVFVKKESGYFLDLLVKQKKTALALIEHARIYDDRKKKNAELDVLTPLYGGYKKAILLNDNSNAFKGITNSISKNVLGNNYINIVNDKFSLKNLFNIKINIKKLNKINIKNIVLERYNYIVSRKMENKLTLPYYYFTPKYVAKGMTTQLRSWPNTIYSFIKPTMRNIKYLDLITTNLIKLFLNPSTLKRKIVKGRKGAKKSVRGIIILPVKIFSKYLNELITYTSHRSLDSLKGAIYYSNTILTIPWVKKEIGWIKAFKKLFKERRSGIIGYMPKRRIYFNKARKIWISKPLFRHTAFNVIIDLFIYNNKTYKVGKFHNMIKSRAIYKYMYSMYVNYNQIIQNILERPRILYINIMDPKIFYYYSNVIKSYEKILIYFSKRHFISFLLSILKWNFNNKLFSKLLNINRSLSFDAIMETNLRRDKQILGSSEHSNILNLFDNKYNDNGLSIVPKSNNKKVISPFATWIKTKRIEGKFVPNRDLSRLSERDNYPSRIYVIRKKVPVFKFNNRNNNVNNYIEKSLRLKSKINKYISLYNNEKKNIFINNHLYLINSKVVKSHNKRAKLWWSNNEFFLLKEHGVRFSRTAVKKQHLDDVEKKSKIPGKIDYSQLWKKDQGKYSSTIKANNIGKDKFRVRNYKWQTRKIKILSRPNPQFLNSQIGRYNLSGATEKTYTNSNQKGVYNNNSKFKVQSRKNLANSTMFDLFKEKKKSKNNTKNFNNEVKNLKNQGNNVNIQANSYNKHRYNNNKDNARINYDNKVNNIITNYNKDYNTNIIGSSNKDHYSEHINNRNYEHKDRSSKNNKFVANSYNKDNKPKYKENKNYKFSDVSGKRKMHTGTNIKNKYYNKSDISASNDKVKGNSKIIYMNKNILNKSKTLPIEIKVNTKNVKTSITKQRSISVLSLLNTKKKQLTPSYFKKYQANLSVSPSGVLTKSVKKITSAQINQKISEKKIKYFQLSKFKTDKIYPYPTNKSKSFIKLGKVKVSIAQRNKEIKAGPALVFKKMWDYHLIGKRMNTIRKIDKRWDWGKLMLDPSRVKWGLKSRKQGDWWKEFIKYWNTKKNVSFLHKGCGRSDIQKINHIKYIKDMYYNEKEAIAKNINIKLKVFDKEQNKNYDLRDSKTKKKWDKLDYSILKMIVRMIVSKEEAVNSNINIFFGNTRRWINRDIRDWFKKIKIKLRLKKKVEKKSSDTAKKTKVKDNEDKANKNLISKYLNYTYNKIVGKIKNYLGNNDKLYIDIIKQDFYNINRDVIINKSLENINYEFDTAKNSYNLGYCNKNLYYEIMFNWGNMKGFTMKIWQTLNLNKREDNLIHILRFSDKVFKPYYRYILRLFILNEYKIFLNKLGYINILISWYIPMVFNRLNWFKDNNLKLFNFIGVKTLFNLFTFSYRSLYIIKPKYYYINKFRFFKRKASRLKFNTWLKSIRFLKHLRKTPKSYWLRYHRVINFYYIKILNLAKWDTERKVLMPYVLYIEDVLYNIYGKLALIRIWPLKKYFLSCYIVSERLMLLLDKRANHSRKRRSITSEFTRFVFRFINYINMIKMDKVYDYNMDNSSRWPKELISVINTNIPIASNFNKLEYYSKKLESPYSLNSFLMRNGELDYYIPLIKFFYNNLAKDFYSNIRWWMKKTYKWEIKVKKGLVRYWTRPIRKFLLDITDVTDLSGVEFRLAGRAKARQRSFSLIYQRGSFLTTRHYNKITHKYLTATNSYLRNTIKINKEFTQRAGNFTPGTSNLKLWYASLLSSDIIELLSFMLKIKEIYNALMNRNLLVHTNIQYYMKYYKFTSYNVRKLLRYFKRVNSKLKIRFKLSYMYRSRSKILNNNWWYIRPKGKTLKSNYRIIWYRGKILKNNYRSVRSICKIMKNQNIGTCAKN